MEKKKNKLKFSWFYYLLAGFAAFLWRLFMRIKLKKTREFKNQKGAYLIVANHASSLDMLAAIGVVFPKKQNFVVAENMLYHSGFFARVLTKFGAILKRQFVSDFSCVKSIKRYLDGGVPVLICPEGKVSDDGVTMPIVPSTGKLVKWLNHPVAAFVSRGGSLIRPKWAKTLRRGKMVIECGMALTKEDIQKMTADEINERLFRALYNNDHEYQRQHKLRFGGRRLAEGLEHILYKCPRCKTEFEMETRGKILQCKRCGNAARYDEYGEISAFSGDCVVFPRIDLWREFVKDSLNGELKNDGFEVSARVEKFVDDTKARKYFSDGCGTLALNNKKLFYIPDDTNKQGNTLLLSTVPSLASVPGLSLTIYDKDQIVKFIFTGKKMSTKFTTAVELLSQKT